MSRQNQVSEEQVERHAQQLASRDAYRGQLSGYLDRATRAEGLHNPKAAVVAKAKDKYQKLMEQSGLGENADYGAKREMAIWALRSTFDSAVGEYFEATHREHGGSMLHNVGLGLYLRETQEYVEKVVADGREDLKWNDRHGWFDKMHDLDVPTWEQFVDKSVNVWYNGMREIARQQLQQQAQAAAQQRAARRGRGRREPAQAREEEPEEREPLTEQELNVANTELAYKLEHTFNREYYKTHKKELGEYSKDVQRALLQADGVAVVEVNNFAKKVRLKKSGAPLADFWYDSERNLQTEAYKVYTNLREGHLAKLDLVKGTDYVALEDGWFTKEGTWKNVVLKNPKDTAKINLMKRAEKEKKKRIKGAIVGGALGAATVAIAPVGYAFATGMWFPEVAALVTTPLYAGLSSVVTGIGTALGYLTPRLRESRRERADVRAPAEAQRTRRVRGRGYSVNGDEGETPPPSMPPAPRPPTVPPPTRNRRRGVLETLRSREEPRYANPFEKLDAEKLSYNGEEAKGDVPSFDAIFEPPRAQPPEPPKAEQGDAELEKVAQAASKPEGTGA